MATNALLNDGDELLAATPDYPLWTAAAGLSGGTPVHYPCDEGQRLDAQPGRHPRQDHAAHQGHRGDQSRTTRRARCTPTSCLRGIVDIAREHGLVMFADECTTKCCTTACSTLPSRSLGDDVLTLTFNSLSKSYRSCGYRAGWMVVSGDKRSARDYIEGLNMLSNMRLCANVPGQWAIQTALGGLPEHQ